MYEQRCKLYRFYKDEEKDIKEWRERGIGDVKILKHKETRKIRYEPILERRVSNVEKGNKIFFFVNLMNFYSIGY